MTLLLLLYIFSGKTYAHVLYLMADSEGSRYVSTGKMSQCKSSGDVNTKMRKRTPSSTFQRSYLPLPVPFVFRVKGITAKVTSIYVQVRGPRKTSLQGDERWGNEVSHRRSDADKGNVPPPYSRCRCSGIRRRRKCLSRASRSQRP